MKIFTKQISAMLTAIAVGSMTTGFCVETDGISINEETKPQTEVTQTAGEIVNIPEETPTAGIVAYSTTASESTIDTETYSYTTESTTTTTTNETTDSNIVYGDVNLDKKINISDVITFNRYFVGSVTFNDEAIANGDCVYDGVLNINDNFEIVRYICRIISQYELGPQK